MQVRVQVCELYMHGRRICHPFDYMPALMPKYTLAYLLSLVAELFVRILYLLTLLAAAAQV
jgi:hypothetical protein